MRRLSHKEKDHLLERMAEGMREGALLFAVFGIVDGLIGHRELNDLGWPWFAWVTCAMLIAVAAFFGSLRIEYMLLQRKEANQ